MNRLGRAANACQNLLAGLPRRVETSSHLHLRYQLFSTASPSHNTQAEKADHNQLTNLTLKLINLTSQAPTGWTHTHSLRGTEKRLTASLINPTMGRAPSIEKTTYNTGEPMDIDREVEVNDGSISPGTFIETRR
jgi:hypothetical protein